MKLLYMAYPYTDGPYTRTKEIREKILELLKVRTDIVIFSPHLAFDALHDWNVEGYQTEYEFILSWELEIISRCDAICVPPYEGRPSAGVAWEKAYAQRLGIPEYQYEDLLAGTEIQDDVAEIIIREAERELMVV